MKYGLITKTHKYNGKLINTEAISSNILNNLKETGLETTYTPPEIFIIYYGDVQSDRGLEKTCEYLNNKVLKLKLDIVYIADDSNELHRYIKLNSNRYLPYVCNYSETQKNYPLEFAV